MLTEESTVRWIHETRITTLDRPGQLASEMHVPTWVIRVVIGRVRLVVDTTDVTDRMAIALMEIHGKTLACMTAA
jgi:hypothetical protein